MHLNNPGYRAAGLGVGSAALLIGAFILGTSHLTGSPARAATTATAPHSPGRITVIGTGTVTGTPNQLVVDMGVQVSDGSVTSALDQANQVVSHVTSALRGQGVAAADIQTSGLSIAPNYRSYSQVPVSYQVSESITGTLNQVGAAGRQIEAGVDAGGNAVTVDDVSLNLTDDGPLLAVARANAMRDARTKAAQLAGAAGETLGQVLTITQVSSGSPAVFEPAAANAASGAVPISAGSQQVSVSVTVVYAAG